MYVQNLGFSPRIIHLQVLQGPEDGHGHRQSFCCGSEFTTLRMLEDVIVVFQKLAFKITPINISQRSPGGFGSVGRPMVLS
jgi:hypothetical protein